MRANGAEGEAFVMRMPFPVGVLPEMAIRPEWTLGLVALVVRVKLSDWAFVLVAPVQARHRRTALGM